MQSLKELINDATEELNIRLIEMDKYAIEDDLQGIIHEVAECLLPVYTHEILSLALENPRLAVSEPEN